MTAESFYKQWQRQRQKMSQKMSQRGLITVSMIELGSTSTGTSTSTTSIVTRNERIGV